MTGERSSSRRDKDDNAGAAFDLDLLYRNLGELVVVFQALETAVFQLGVLALGLDDFERSRRQLADRSFKDLCARVEEAVLKRLNELGRPAPALREGLRETMKRCDRLRQQRNSIVHSAYVSLEAGGELHGMVRANLRRDRASRGVSIEHEQLRASSLTQVTREMAEAAWAVERTRVQLAMWTPSDSRVPPAG